MSRKFLEGLDSLEGFAVTFRCHFLPFSHRDFLQNCLNCLKCLKCETQKKANLAMKLGS